MAVWEIDKTLWTPKHHPMFIKKRVEEEWWL